MHPIQSEADPIACVVAAGHMTISAWASAGLEALGDGEMRPPGPARRLACHFDRATILGHLAWCRPTVNSGHESSGSGAVSERSLGLHPPRGHLPLSWRLARGSRSGTAIQDTDIGVVESDPERVRRFTCSRSIGARRSLAHVALGGPLAARGGRVLTLRRAHGRYAAEMAKQGMEPPRSTSPSAQIPVSPAGTDYVLNGDFHTDDLGGPYDAILVSNIVHGLGEGATALLKRLVAALAPNGRIVVGFSAQGRVSARGRCAVWLVMLMYTKEGRTYTIAEMQDLLALSGLAPEQVVEASELGYELVVGRKLD